MRVFKKSELVDVHGWIQPNGEATAIPARDFHILFTGYGDERCISTDQEFSEAGWTRIEGQKLIDRLTSIGYQVIDDPRPENKKFWMVWSPQGNRPTYKHPHEHLAIVEAERLAKEFPTREFYVLEAISVSKINHTITTRIDPRIPF